MPYKKTVSTVHTLFSIFLSHFETSVAEKVPLFTNSRISCASAIMIRARNFRSVLIIKMSYRKSIYQSTENRLVHENCNLARFALLWKYLSPSKQTGEENYVIYNWLTFFSLKAVGRSDQKYKCKVPHGEIYQLLVSI